MSFTSNFTNSTPILKLYSKFEELTPNSKLTSNFKSSLQISKISLWIRNAHYVILNDSTLYSKGSFPVLNSVYFGKIQLSKANVNKVEMKHDLPVKLYATKIYA